MKVLEVMASGERGGGADHLLTLLPALRTLGVECEAGVSENGPLAERLELRGFRVHRLSLMGSRVDPRIPYQLARLVREVGSDLVHWHGTRAAFFGALALRLARGRARGEGVPPAVYTVHGVSYRQGHSVAGTSLGRALFRRAERIACAGARRVISVSATDLTDLERRRFVAPGQGRHLPNAVDLTRFTSGDRRAARARIGIPEEAFVVGTVSRLVPQKTVGDLVEAVARVPQVTLAVAGDGPDRATVERRIRALGVGDRVRLLGARDDVPELLPAFDLFALSSRWEGEPIALLEAMAAGLPCVATAAGGVREVLAGGEVGVLVPVGDPAAMASAIESLRTDPERRARLALAGRARVAGRTPERLAEDVLEVYREVAS
jgi:glycosyltransferase involved in cell wall biosynthesis